MKFETKTIHEGQPNDPLTGAVSLTICQTSIYRIKPI